MKNALKACFVALLILFPLFLRSQNIEIKGKILSIEDNQPVPFATVSVPRLKTGTSADVNGYFVLEISSYKDTDILQISSVGYLTQSIQLSTLKGNEYRTYLMEPAVLELDEQSVIAKKLDPKTIIEQAAKKRKRIMSSRPYLITTVYNEQLSINERSVGVMQGFGVAYIDGYNERNYSDIDQPRDQVQWKQIRRSGYDTDQFDYTSYLGAYKLLKAKDVYLYNGPVSTSNLGKYNYYLDSISSYGDELVFMIRFQSKQNKGLFGNIIIDELTYSILSLEVYNEEEKKNYDFFNKKIKPRSSAFRLSMSKAGKIYYISAISLKLTSVKKIEEEEVEVKENLSLSAGQFNQSDRVPATNQAQKKVLFYEMVNPLINYSENFWSQKEELIFPVMISDAMQKEFNSLNGKRIVPLPDGFTNYQQLYNDRQLLDQYFTDF